MKAVLALIVIYVGTFLVAIQGASQNPPQAATQNGAGNQEPATNAAKTIDPAKEADIRSLMELLGVRDIVQDSETKGIEQFRENLLASVPDNERGQAFVNAFVDSYQKKFNPDEVNNEMVGIYDKYFTDEEIKGLLQFYGSPLGQKYAAQMPRIFGESAVASRAMTMRIAKEVLQDLRKQYPGVAAQARLTKPGHMGELAQLKQQGQASPSSQNKADSSQP